MSAFRRPLVRATAALPAALLVALLVPHAPVTAQRAAVAPDTIPDVVGSPLARATEAFHALGVQVTAVHRLQSRTEPGLVLRQLPAAGTPVRTDLTGELWVSIGPGEERPPTLPTIPEVTGLPLEQARLAFLEVKLSLDDVRFAPSETPEGIVIAQRPPAGAEWSPDLRAAVVVSTGPRAPARVAVPDVTGRTVSEAFRLLTDAELRGDITEYVEDREERGRVVAQAPVQGSTVLSGTVVGLSISLGPQVAGVEPDVQTDPVTVPDLIGLSDEAAERVASALRFQFRARTVPADDAEPATVVAQQPAPGAQVAEGSMIDVDVAPTAAWVVPAWALPLAVVLVGLAGFVRKRKRSRARAADTATLRSEHAGPPPGAPVAFRPRPGELRQHVATADALIQDLEVRLAPRPTAPATVRVDAHGPITRYPGGTQ